jgi:hypothetical protein
VVGAVNWCSFPWAGFVVGLCNCTGLCVTMFGFIWGGWWGGGWGGVGESMVGVLYVGIYCY